MNKNILKNLRKQNNLTQAELAKKLGISKSTIGMYEQGRRCPDNKTLVNISKIFDVSTDYILGVNSGNKLYGNKKMPKELDDILSNLKNSLLSDDDIMFEGHKLSRQDIDKILTAIKTGVTVAISKEDN